MSSSSAPRLKTYTAGADLSAKKNRIAKLDTDSQTVLVASAAGDKTFGILMNDPASGCPAEVAIPGGGARVKAGGTVALGDLLTSDASGDAIVSTAGTDRIIGVAMQDAVAGDVFGIEVQISLGGV